MSATVTPEQSNRCCCDHENSSPAKKCISLIISVNRAHKCMIENYVDQTGIHRSQHHMLMILARSPKVPSQKELAERLNISPAAVAVTLKKLEKLGYIERCAAENDNRYNETRITAKGKALLEDTRNMFEKIDEAVFEGFSPEDLERLSDYMKKIHMNIRNCEAAAVTEEQKG